MHVLNHRDKHEALKAFITTMNFRPAIKNSHLQLESRYIYVADGNNGDYEYCHPQRYNIV